MPVKVIGANEIAKALGYISESMLPVFEASTFAAAKVLRGAVQEATPVMKAAESFYTLPPHASGQARANVIIYKRKNKDLTKKIGEASYLVGYAKKDAYYMYWYEYGRGAFKMRPRRKKVLSFQSGGKTIFAKSVTVGAQPPRPFMRSAVDTRQADAFEAAAAEAKKQFERMPIK